MASKVYMKSFKRIRNLNLAVIRHFDEKNILFLLIMVCFHSLSFANANNIEDKFIQILLSDAFTQTQKSVTYDGSYKVIPYPNGDVDEARGVCSDVIIRCYRKAGIDLQKLVHEDMLINFSQYPNIWKLSSPDSNIDHRRVPNLMVFFQKYGKSLPMSKNPEDYKPGDLVTWNIGTWWRFRSNVPHIGIVFMGKTDSSRGPLIIHNIGFGPKIEDMLFDYPITGHYRYIPENSEK